MGSDLGVWVWWLGLGIWDVGVQGWGFGFRVWDSGLRVYQVSKSSAAVLNYEQLLYRNVQRFREGLVLKAHKL